MASQFHKLKVRDLRRETADTVSISFELPENERAAFHYHQGQHLTLKVDIDGEEVRRSYSICTGTHENDLRVAVKKVERLLFVPGNAFSATRTTLWWQVSALAFRLTSVYKTRFGCA